MHLVLRKCYNQKILSNHPMKICPFWCISDRKLKFRYLKPQVNIWKCKINSLNEILNKILPKKFIFGDSILIVAQQTRNFFFFFFFLLNQGIKLRIFTSRVVSLKHFLSILLPPFRGMSFGLFTYPSLD